MMGSPKSEQDALNVRDAHAIFERPFTVEVQHRVTLTKAFYVGKYEVTQRQWARVMGSNPSHFTDPGFDAPVEQVNWHDCTNFMEKLAALERMPEGSFRLPTEAEWEYACRAGTEMAFCYGNEPDSNMANFNGSLPSYGGKTGVYRMTTIPVGSFKPNAWGLYDMHGNVFEWCADWDGEYAGDATDPTGPVSGKDRVVRGGCYRAPASGARSAYRGYDEPRFVARGTGFRLVAPAAQQ